MNTVAGSFPAVLPADSSSQAIRNRKSRFQFIERRELQMRNLIKYAALALLVGFMATSANSQMPGKHPEYLHALSDLRTARYLLAHQSGDKQVYADEDVAIKEIEAAIGEIKRASIDDGKDLNDHPHVDATEHGSRLLKSMELLKSARGDVNREEDNPETHGLKVRASEHIDKALEAADRAHSRWLKDMGK